MNGDITIIVNTDLIKISVRDKASREIIVSVNITPSGFCDALGRLGNVPCDIDVGVLERVGKKHECKKLEFPLPDSAHQTRKETAILQCSEYLPDGGAA